jgi:hypothetical protein
MPKKPLYIGTSPLTNRIYAGHVLQDGQTWAADKEDVTGAACAAVAQHVLKSGDYREPVIVTANGAPKYEIAVKDLQSPLHAPTPEGAEWVVHVLGPDDVIDQPDELTALRVANATNKMIWNLPRHEHDPLVVALVKNKKTEAL